MIQTVIFRQPAVEDVIEAAAWYEAHAPGHQNRSTPAFSQHEPGGMVRRTQTYRVRFNGSLVRALAPGPDNLSTSNFIRADIRPNKTANQPEKCKQ